MSGGAASLQKTGAASAAPWAPVSASAWQESLFELPERFSVRWAWANLLRDRRGPDCPGRCRRSIPKFGADLRKYPTRTRTALPQAKDRKSRCNDDFTNPTLDAHPAS